MIKPDKSDALWYAFLLHRISGIALALFLPVHFYILSLAMTQPARFNSFIDWIEHPLVKFAEFGLVFLLAAHMLGGIRLLALEFLPWSAKQKTFAAVAISLSFLVACLFLLSAL